MSQVIPMVEASPRDTGGTKCKWEGREDNGYGQGERESLFHLLL